MFYELSVCFGGGGKCKSLDTKQHFSMDLISFVVSFGVRIRNDVHYMFVKHSVAGWHCALATHSTTAGSCTRCM